MAVKVVQWIPAYLVLALAMGSTPISSGDDDMPPVTPIQPGAPTQFGGTLGFIFQSTDETNDDGLPTLFAVKAGHGQGTVGDQQFLSNGTLIGTIVAEGTGGRDDWALVRIDEASQSLVSFAVRHWGGPTGLPGEGEIKRGDVSCWFGHAFPMNLHPETRPRCGRIDGSWEQDGVRGLYFRGYTYVGDSGSPLIHHETGRALGMNIALQVDGEGITIGICSLIQRFQDAGFHLELAGAEYNQPPTHLLTPPVATPQVLWGYQAAHCRV